MAIHADEGCNGPVTATGYISWSEWEYHPPIRDPTRLVLGVAGVRILRVEVRDPKSSIWRTVPFGQRDSTYVAEGLIAGWSDSEEAAFRLTFLGSRTAGFDACYLTSPELFDFRSSEAIALETRLSGETYLAEHHRGSGVGGDPLTDAIVTMSVQNQQPDRFVLDAGAHVRHGKAVLTCTDISPETPPIYRSHPFFGTLSLFSGESACGSIQIFRSSDASESLSRHVFFAGILISAAVGILLEVFLTGRLDTDNTEDRRTAKPG
jgi:hypothetical protein